MMPQYSVQTKQKMYIYYSNEMAAKLVPDTVA